MAHNRYLERVLRDRIQAEAKQCYKNSVLALYVMRSRKRYHPDHVFYVEGWLGGVMPIEHGWLEVSGKVVDVTLPGKYPSEAYFPGQRFEMLTVLKAVLSSSSSFMLPITLTPGRKLKAHRFPPFGFSCPEYKQAYEACNRYCFSEVIPNVLAGKV